MEALNVVDIPCSDVDRYVTTLSVALKSQEQEILDLRARLRVFSRHLQEERELSTLFQNAAGRTARW